MPIPITGLRWRFRRISGSVDLDAGETGGGTVYTCPDGRKAVILAVSVRNSSPVSGSWVKASAYLGAPGAELLAESDTVHTYVDGAKEVIAQKFGIWLVMHPGDEIHVGGYNADTSPHVLSWCISLMEVL